MKISHPSHERGQSVILISVMLLAFIAILALVLDGGLAYASRRKAQNAADAGALAGASELCRGSSAATAEALAVSYAVNNNQATAATATANTTDATITVNATITYHTTFAALLGNPTGDAAATARAGCFAVCSAKTVLPVGWSCKPPILNSGSDSATCEIEYGDADATPSEYEDQPLYIIMDTNQLCSGDYTCQSEGGMLDCDYDDDGIDDTFLECDNNSGRSWLDLNGGSSTATELAAWINGGYPNEIYLHSWLPLHDGNFDNAYTQAENRVGDIVTVPVTDRQPCMGVGNTENVQTVCSDLWHTGLDTQPYVQQDDFYHISALALFRITCVHSQNNDPDYCPAWEELKVNLSPAQQSNMQTIEGYFINGFNSEMRRCPPGSTYTVDAGAYTVNLIP